MGKDRGIPRKERNPVVSVVATEKKETPLERPRKRIHSESSASCSPSVSVPPNLGGTLDSLDASVSVKKDRRQDTMLKKAASILADEFELREYREPFSVGEEEWKALRLLECCLDDHLSVPEEDVEMTEELLCSEIAEIPEAIRCRELSSQIEALEDKCNILDMQRAHATTTACIRYEEAEEGPRRLAPVRYVDYSRAIWNSIRQNVVRSKSAQELLKRVCDDLNEELEHITIGSRAAGRALYLEYIEDLRVFEFRPSEESHLEKGFAYYLPIEELWNFQKR
jgi:hypothetical protein